MLHPASDFHVYKWCKSHEEAHQHHADPARQIIQAQQSSNQIAEKKRRDEDDGQHSQNQPSIGSGRINFRLEQKKAVSKSVHS